MTISIILTERLKLLHSIIEIKENKIIPAEGILVKTVEEAQEFYNKSLKAGNEGIMIKDLEGLYTPGGRVTAWIKFKPIMEELDLVIVGAEWGEGKRSAWLTSFVLACKDEDGDFVGFKQDIGKKDIKREDKKRMEELKTQFKSLLWNVTSSCEVESSVGRMIKFKGFKCAFTDLRVS